MKKINVLSLFGGIECGRVAIERIGFPVGEYFSSEIDKTAMEIAKRNYPDVIHIGSVSEVSYHGGWLQNAFDDD